MKNIVKMLCLILAIVLGTSFMSINILYVGAIVSNAEEVVEEKIYCSATIDEDFADDRVLVVFNNETSLDFKTYEKDDFSDIQCKSVSEITKAIGNKARAKVRSTQNVYSSLFVSGADNDVDVDSFNQVIRKDIYFCCTQL